MPRIALSGAVAVGKSTLCAALSQLHPSIQPNQEDVTEFRFLGSFYEDPSRFAFHSRVEFLAIKGAELARSADSANVAVLFDRVLPELVTFARVMRTSGMMSQREYLVYEDVWRILLGSLPQFDAFVWVRCDTQTCLKRIAMRDRPYERGIDAGYLDALDTEYRRWRDEMSERYPLLSVDTTDGDPHLPRRVADWLTSLGLLPPDVAHPATE